MFIRPSILFGYLACKLFGKKRICALFSTGITIASFI